MMRMMRFALVLATCALAARAEAAVAQGVPDSVHHRNDCRLARQVLVQGHPANRRSWALARLSNCGSDAVEVLRYYLNRHRSDENYGRPLDEVVTASFGLVDRNLAFAALSIAKSESSGTAARIQALRLLYAQVTPTTTVSFQRFTRPEIVSVTTRDDGNQYNRIEPLDPDFVIDRWVVVTVTPLGAGDTEQLATELRAVADGAQHPELRIAAQRAAAAFRSHVRCPPGASAQSCVARFRSERNPK